MSNPKPTAKDALAYAQRRQATISQTRYIAKQFLLSRGVSISETLQMMEEVERLLAGEHAAAPEAVFSGPPKVIDNWPPGPKVEPAPVPVGDDPSVLPIVETTV